MKLYVVTAGRYSDYHIVGAFESEEKAKLYVELNDPTNYYSVGYYCEETLDDRLMDINDRRKLYSVDIYPDTGKMIVEEDRDYDHLAPDPKYTEFHEHQVWDWKNNSQCVTVHSIVVLADNDDQALKIAQDKYAEYKAEKAGII